jgi:hypothetical protein
MPSLLGTVAMLTTFAGAQEAPPTLDLFLVARNGWRVENLDWLDKKDPVTGIQSVLQARLKDLDAQRKSFMILDGGDCPLFPKRNEWVVRHLERNYGEYDSMTQTSVERGVEKKRVLARTFTTGTSMGSVYVQPNMAKPYYTSRIYSYPFGHDKTKPSICFQDVNSYRLSSASTQAQDREGLDRTLLFSPLTLDQTRQFLVDRKVDFNGVCISPSGLPQKDAPNLIAFPPAGIIAHYALSREEGRWTARLVGYLRVPTEAGR